MDRRLRFRGRTVVLSTASPWIPCLQNPGADVHCRPWVLTANRCPSGDRVFSVAVNVEAKLGGSESGPGLRWAIYLVTLVALAAAYFVTGMLGLSLAITQANVTLIWPPSGIALAAILLRGNAMWPGVALGAFWVGMSTGVPVPTAVCIAGGNTAEALFAAWLLRRVGMDLRLLRTWDVLALLFLGALVPTLVSATLGVGSLYGTGVIAAPAVAGVWTDWWLGDTFGVMFSAPLLLSWGASRASGITPRYLVEAMVIGLCTVIAGLAAVGEWDVAGEGVLVLIYVPLIFIVGAAIRCGPRGVSAAVCLLAAVVVWGTADGIGPFVRDPAHESLVLLYGYIMATSFIGLLTAGAIAESKQREVGARQNADELLFKTTLLEAQTEASIDGILVVDSEGRAVSFNGQFGKLWNIPEELLAKKDDEQMLEYVVTQLEDPQAFLAKVDHLYQHRELESRDEIELKGRRVFDRYSAPLVDNTGNYHGRIWFFRDITDRKNMEREQENLIVALTKAVANIKSLHGLLPICANCKKIRDDTGYWHQVEAYVRDHTEADFTHGVCPDCVEAYRREMGNVEFRAQDASEIDNPPGPS